MCLTGPGTPSALGQMSPTEGDSKLPRPLETQPPQQQPPQDTGQKPGPEPCPGSRVPREGRPLRTTTTHHPGHTQDRPGKDLVVPPLGDSGQRLQLQRVLPAPAPTPQQHLRQGHFLSLNLPSLPRDTPICQGTVPSGSSPKAAARACLLLRLAQSPGGAQAACQSSRGMASAQPQAELLTAGSSGACRTVRREQRWGRASAQAQPPPPSSPGLSGLLFKRPFHVPPTVVNLFSACNSGARALPQSLPAAEAQEPPTGSLTAEKGQVTPRAHPWPPAGLGESEPGPQAASHPWERGTGLQAGKAGALTDPGLRKLKRSCTGGEFELLTQTTAAVGKVDEARGCLQLTPRKPWTTAQASPHSLSADSQGSRGKPRCTR